MSEHKIDYFGETELTVQPKSPESGVPVEKQLIASNSKVASVVVRSTERYSKDEVVKEEGSKVSDFHVLLSDFLETSLQDPQLRYYYTKLMKRCELAWIISGEKACLEAIEDYKNEIAQEDNDAAVRFVEHLDSFREEYEYYREQLEFPDINILLQELLESLVAENFEINKIRREEDARRRAVVAKKKREEGSSSEEESE